MGHCDCEESSPSQTIYFHEREMLARVRPGGSSEGASQEYEDDDEGTHFNLHTSSSLITSQLCLKDW